MHSQTAGQFQNLEQNPKSILSDRNHHVQQPVEKLNDHNLHVTFAKAIHNNNNKSNLSYNANSHPSSYLATKAQSPTPRERIRSPAEGGSSNIKTVANQVVAKNDTEVKTGPIVGPNANGRKVKDNNSVNAPVKKADLEKVLKQNPRVGKAFADWLSPTKSFTAKQKTKFVSSTKTKSTERIEKSETGGSARNIDATTLVHWSKSKKRLLKLKKPSVRSLSGPSKRTKSSKKKRSKKTISSKVDNEDIETIKPAPVNAEYASELSKISQILKAVNAYNEPLGIGSKAESLQGKSIQMQGEGLRVSETGEYSMHRPLSGDELKQLLSSITRVVSLHQLPISQSHSKSSLGLQTEKLTSTDSKHTLGNIERKGDPEGETVSGKGVKNRKSKKRRKVKTFPAISAITNRESLRARARLISNRPSQGVPPPRRSRPKSKSVGRSKKGISNSERSSVSSLEKDPVQNAVFLRKYFEESTRLANKQSSELLILESEPIGESTRSKKSTTANIKTVGISADSSKRNLITKKPTQQSLVPSTLGRKSNDKTESSQKLSKVYKSPSNSKKANVDKNRTRRHHHRSKSTKISTTAVAGSPTPHSPIHNQGDGENINESADAEILKKILLETKNLTPIVQTGTVMVKTPPPVGSASSGSGAPKQEQFKNVDEIIKSNKLSVNTTTTGKMKSVWEKTPYQPMTHARFRDMVSKYANPPDATIVLANTEENSQPIKASINIPATTTFTTGNLLSLPKPWEIKEKLAEEANRDKTVKELQGPPRYWPDSTSLYNTLDIDYKQNARRNARNSLRKTLKDDLVKTRPVTTAIRDEQFLHSTGAPPDEVSDALKFYRNAIKRDKRNSEF